MTQHKQEENQTKFGFQNHKDNTIKSIFLKTSIIRPSTKILTKDLLNLISII